MPAAIRGTATPKVDQAIAGPGEIVRFSGKSSRVIGRPKLRKKTSIRSRSPELEGSQTLPAHMAKIVTRVLSRMEIASVRTQVVGRHASFSASCAITLLRRRAISLLSSSAATTCERWLLDMRFSVTYDTSAYVGEGALSFDLYCGNSAWQRWIKSAVRVTTPQGCWQQNLIQTQRAKLCGLFLLAGSGVHPPIDGIAFTVQTVKRNQAGVPALVNGLER